VFFSSIYPAVALFQAYQLAKGFVSVTLSYYFSVTRVLQKEKKKKKSFFYGSTYVFLACASPVASWRPLEHLQEFAKIHLTNIMIWQLAKIYGK
jgi:hypothetical protein